MSNSPPSKTVSRLATYLVARRMESVGMLRPGQATLLANALPAKAETKTTKRGKKR